MIRQCRVCSCYEFMKYEDHNKHWHLSILLLCASNYLRNIIYKTVWYSFSSTCRPSLCLFCLFDRIYVDISYLTNLYYLRLISTRFQTNCLNDIFVIGGIANRKLGQSSTTFVVVDNNLRRIKSPRTKIIILIWLILKFTIASMWGLGSVTWCYSIPIFYVYLCFIIMLSYTTSNWYEGDRVWECRLQLKQRIFY